VIRSELCDPFWSQSTQRQHNEHKVISISHLLHSIHHVCQLMNNAVSFGLLFSFLYSVKLYFMKHVVKGGILAFVVICLYAFITVVASAL